MIDFKNILGTEELADAAQKADLQAKSRSQRSDVRQAFFAQLERQCFPPGRVSEAERKKRDALREFCWREWHSAGYREVMGYYVELAGLIRA